MSTTIEVEVAGNMYLLPKLSAMQQLHVSRRLGPVLLQGFRFIAAASAKVPEALKAVPQDGTPQQQMDNAEVTEAITSLSTDELVPFMQGLASLPDADVDYVVRECLTPVQRRLPNGLGLSPILARDITPLRFQFPDLEMPQIMNLTARMLWHNLRGFMPAAVQNLSVAATP